MSTDAINTDSVNDDWLFYGKGLVGGQSAMYVWRIGDYQAEEGYGEAMAAGVRATLGIPDNYNDLPDYPAVYDLCLADRLIRRGDWSHAVMQEGLPAPWPPTPQP